MTRTEMILRIGKEYHTANIEGGEYSYVQEAGSKAKLEKALGHSFSHFKLDIRFELNDVAVLIETKQSFTKNDEDQLAEYVEEEFALHNGKKIIAILANTNNDEIKVWKSVIDGEHILTNETVLDKMEHYVGLFDASKQNDREKVLKNTYDLNELLHKMDIDERLRSQFVGTTLLYLKKLVEKFGATKIDETLKKKLDTHWSMMDGKQIRAAIESTLDDLLDGSENKSKKIELLQKNVLNDQKVKKLDPANWIKILDTILMDIYQYIDPNSSEGQDILNLFFIAFNKYTGKADKNQAFTPDHITEFMCRLTDVDRTKRVLDITCGSASFLVQAMVKELADCNRDTTEDEAKVLQEIVKKDHIYGIENEEKAYGLSTTNMLIHGDGNSNIKFGSCFECKQFIKTADPDIVLMNPPYNAKPIGIPERYKKEWGKAKDGKEDPTKGFVFIHYLSDVIAEMNKEREKNNEPLKTVKLAVLLPVSAAIGTSSIIESEKNEMLKNNTLEAVFTLPNEIFYPGASASACCMLFTLGKPHKKADGTVNETFFGYCKDDGFKKKKNLGRIEQFDENNKSRWKNIEDEWLYLFNNKKVIDGKSATAIVDGEAEWLCEAYMKTDYANLTSADFQKTVNNYYAYLIKEGKQSKADYPQKINVAKWKEFRIGSLFRIEPTKGKVSDELIEGDDVPYIGAKHELNGYMMSCQKEGYEDWISKGNCIIFIQLGAGSAGYANYIETDFIGMNGKTSCGYIDGVMNKYIGQFLETILCSERPKYSFGRSWTGKRLEDTVINLPVQFDDKGNVIIDSSCQYSSEGYIPDWSYMEEYIKSLPYGDKI